MFQRESIALFHEHLKAYAIIGISATGERPSLAGVRFIFLQEPPL